MSFILFLSCVLAYHFFDRSMTTVAHRGKRVNLLSAAHLVLLSRVGQSPRRLSGIPQRWYICDRHIKPRVSPCFLFLPFFRMYLISVLVISDLVILTRSCAGPMIPQPVSGLLTFLLTQFVVSCSIGALLAYGAGVGRASGHVAWMAEPSTPAGAVAPLSPSGCCRTRGDAARASHKGHEPRVLKRPSRRHRLPPVTHPLPPAALVHGRQQLPEGAGGSASPPPARPPGAGPTSTPPVRPPGAVPTPARPPF